MADIVVTLPKSFRHPCAPGRVGLAAWLCEGDAAGELETGFEYCWTTSGRPDIEIGERVYVVHNARLIGYAPLIVMEHDGYRAQLIRGGDAQAVSTFERIRGFRGYRYRWWDRADERRIVNWPEIVAAAQRNEPLPEMLLGETVEVV